MSITAVKGEGVTVITVATDRKSMLPPLCQILKTLCYSPMCCSAYDGLKQSNTVSVLGAIQIMVGLFNIALGPGRTSLHPGDFAHLGVAYWLGGLFTVIGIMTLLANRFPSPCLVGSNVFMNIIGSIFAIVGIVLYAIDMGDAYTARICDWGRYDDRRTRHDDNCESVAYFFLRLLTAMDISMIVLVVLQMFVCVRITILGIMGLLNLRKKGGRDDEIDQPVLKEVLMTTPGA